MGWNDEYVDEEAFLAVRDAARRAYRRAAEMVLPRIAESMVAAAGQSISDQEWFELTEEVSDAYGDAYLDAIVNAGAELGVMPSDDDLLAILAQQEEAVNDFASTLRGYVDMFSEDVVTQGLPIEEIQNRILDAGQSPLNPRKADTFARTATASAVNAGFESSFRAAGIAAKSWITQRDDRVRESHGAVDRDVVPAGEMFMVGGYEARFPGDPRLPIEQRINCRCVLGWVDGGGIRRAVSGTRKELYSMARQLEVPGRSKMNKAELQVSVIRELCLQGLAGGTDCTNRLEEMNMGTLLTYGRLGNVRGRYRMRKATLIDALRGVFDITTAVGLGAKTAVLANTHSDWLGNLADEVVAGTPVAVPESRAKELFALLDEWPDPVDRSKVRIVEEQFHLQGQHDQQTHAGGGRPKRTFEAGDRPSIFDREQSARWRAEREAVDAWQQSERIVQPVNREQLERFEDTYGQGIESVFPEGTVGATTVPFPSASRRKGEPVFDPVPVRQALVEPVRLQNFDPRTLHATQSGVTREGVDYYLEDDRNGYRATGRTFADQDQAGNRYPVIYRNPRSEQLVILSGHHRATAALVDGRPLEGIYVDPRITVLR